MAAHHHVLVLLCEERGREERGEGGMEGEKKGKRGKGGR